MVQYYEKNLSIKGVRMGKIKLLFSLKNIYIIFVTYFFLGYFYPTYFRELGVYLYIDQYLGMYEYIFCSLLLIYSFSLFMKNPVKKMVLKTRIFFLVVLSISIGYLYLLNMGADLDSQVIIEGILYKNLGYFEVYTFLKVYPFIRQDIFKYILIGLIFISTVIICGKFVKHIFMQIFKFIKNNIDKIKEEKRKKEEERLLEEKRKIEQQIEEEIKNIQKIYGNDDEIHEDEVKKEEKDDDENDTGIEISEEEGDIRTDRILANSEGERD